MMVAKAVVKVENIWRREVARDKCRLWSPIWTVFAPLALENGEVEKVKKNGRRERRIQ